LQLSHQSGEDGKTNHNATLDVKDAVLPSEILRLPLAKATNGLHGFFLSPTVGVWRAQIPWEQVMSERAPHRESSVENYVRRVSDPNEQLRPWDDSELFELGISRAELAGEKEHDGPEQEMPTPEEEAELERLGLIPYEDDIVN
jgi:hypothetical protein